jgi:protein-tyrosine phosphatase
MEKTKYRRRLPIHSIKNLRDLGGYKTTDDRVIRWRTLFRSGHLNKLHGKDIQRFNALNIATIVDFRSNYEKEEEPDMLPEGNNIHRLELPILDEGNSEMMMDLRRRFEENDLDDLDTMAIMANTYQQFATEFSNEYRQFVHELLAAAGKPILWHCTAGKDRAGFASALTLRLLGVPMETIIDDYLLSGQYAKPPRKLMATLFLFRGMKAIRLIQPMYGVHKEWILSTFKTIEEHWGSFDTYVHDALALTEDDVARLRDLYTHRLID